MDTALSTAAAASEVPIEGIAPEEFERIVPLYQRRIYRVLFLLLGDREAADTLTQECFLRGYQKRASFRREASLQTWLLRIALNLARDYRKNRRKAFWSRLIHLGEGRAEELVANRADPSCASPERIVMAREELAIVWSALRYLSVRQRTIFVLRFTEEMSLEEIAQATGLETGTVKSHLFRAVGTLRKQLKEKRHGATLE